MRANLLLALVTATLMLSGCAGLPFSKQQQGTEVGTEVWQERQTHLLTLQDWDLAARIGLKLEDEAFSATLKWKQQQQDYRLLLIAPFGKGTVELYSKDAVVTLRTHDNQLLSATTPEALLQEHFGWTLPVQGLPYWIRGIPEPKVAVDNLLLDEQQRLQRLQQSGWDISYGKYQQVGKYELPAKLKLENEKIRLKLAVKEWAIK